MRFNLLLISDPSRSINMTEAERAAMKTEYGAYIGALRSAGVFVSTDWLTPATEAFAVRAESGETAVASGPALRGPDQVGGYFAIEVGSIDEAIEWAKLCPAARTGAVEVRGSAL